MRSIPLLLAGLTLVAGSACTAADTHQSAPRAPTGAEAIAKAPFAQRYDAIITPVEVAIERFESLSRTLPRDSSVGDFVAIANPFAAIVAEADTALRQVRWPASSLDHIRAQLAADKWLRLYLRGTLDVTLMIPLWRHQIIAAANRVRATRRMVSVDLGLAGG